MSKYKNISRFADSKFIDFSTRDMFEDTLQECGYPFCIRKVDRTKRCSCVNATSDHYNEPDPRCSICSGLGFLYKDRIDLAFKSYEKGPEQTASPKKMRANEMCIFTSYDVFDDIAVAEYSQLLELKTDGNGNIIKGNIPIAIFEVDDAIPYFKQGIRIYWKLRVTRKDV